MAGCVLDAFSHHQCTVAKSQCCLRCDFLKVVMINIHIFWATTPSVLRPCILTYSTVSSDILHPDIQHRQFWHLASWHTAPAVLRSCILTYSTVSSEVLDPDIQQCQFWGHGSWHTALSVLRSWILTYSTVSSEVMDPDIEHRQFWGHGSWYTAPSVTSWILTYSTVSSEVTDPDIQHQCSETPKSSILALWKLLMFHQNQIQHRNATEVSCYSSPNINTWPLKTPATAHFNCIIRPNSGIEVRHKFLTTNNGKGCMNDMNIRTDRDQYTYSSNHI